MNKKVIVRKSNRWWYCSWRCSSRRSSQRWWKRHRHRSRRVSTAGWLLRRKHQSWLWGARRWSWSRASCWARACTRARASCTNWNRFNCHIGRQSIVRHKCWHAKRWRRTSTCWSSGLSWEVPRNLGNVRNWPHR